MTIVLNIIFNTGKIDINKNDLPLKQLDLPERHSSQIDRREQIRLRLVLCPNSHS